MAVLVLLEWWRQHHRSRWGWGWAAVGGIGLYMLFCYGLFGDALAFVHRQGRWRDARLAKNAQREKKMNLFFASPLRSLRLRGSIPFSFGRCCSLGPQQEYT